MRITHSVADDGQAQLVIEFGTGPAADPDRVADAAWEHTHRILTDAQARTAEAQDGAAA